MTTKDTPRLEVHDRWEAIFEPPARAALERALASYVEGRRWYRSKTRACRSARVVAALSLPLAQTRSRIAVVEVLLDDGVRHAYVLPLAFVHGPDAERMTEELPFATVIHLDVRTEGGTRSGTVVDALACEPFLSELLAAFAGGVVAKDGSAEIRFHCVVPFTELTAKPKLVDREQTNTSVFFGRRFVAKVVRKLESGASPDLDVGRFLTAVGFAHTPALMGYAEIAIGTDEPATAGLLHALVPNDGDAWQHALGALASFLDGDANDGAPVDAGKGDVLDRADGTLDAGALARVGPYAELARLLGQRIGEMHAALASRSDDEAFSPEPLDAATRVTRSRAVQRDFERALDLLREREAVLSDRAKAIGRELADRKSALEARLKRIGSLTDSGGRTRVHGDLHLGQILFTGEDFSIIDFEGEPARPLHERKEKRSPIVDVAGMLRSFHYAAISAVKERPESERAQLLPAAQLWHRVTSAMLVRGWLAAVERAGVLPRERAALRTLIDFFVFEKCIYEIRYELDNRPQWVDIPLDGLRELLATDDAKENAHG